MTEQPRYGELRPRPQYGEYATPQDQAQAIAGSHPPLPEALVGHPSVAAVRPPSAPVVSRTKYRRWDLVLTAVLLGYGAVNVLSQLFLDSNLTSVLRQIYSTQGIGEYSPTSLATTLAIVLNVITALLFVATLLVTMAQLHRGRIAFYIPLIGGAIALILAIVFVSVLLAGDPTFLAYTNGIRQ